MLLHRAGVYAAEESVGRFLLWIIAKKTLFPGPRLPEVPALSCAYRAGPLPACVQAGPELPSFDVAPLAAIAGHRPSRRLLQLCRGISRRTYRGLHVFIKGADCLMSCKAANPL